MSNAKDTPADPGDAPVGSPYDDRPTESIARRSVRRPRPDNDDFFDRHGRRPAPEVTGAMAEKAARDGDEAGGEPVGGKQAGGDTAAAGDGGEPTEAIEARPQRRRDPVSGKAAPQRIEPVKRGRKAAAAPVEEDVEIPDADDHGDAGDLAADLDGTADEDEAKTAVIISGADAEPRNAVRMSSSDDPVHTEPFIDTDESVSERSGRRYAEHLTEPPLPYIEPSPTTPLLDDGTGFDGTGYDGTGYDGGLDGDAGYDPEPAPVAPAHARRGTIDLGLLILRVVVGLTFTLHGLQKLTGWMNGPGLDGFADMLKNSADPGLGFTPDATTALAIVGAVSETAGGVLLILGLLTPLAGSAVLGTIAVALTYKVTISGGLWFFASQGDNSGIELELLLAAAAAALILTGPGTYSVDRLWGWSRRPSWGSAAWVVIAIAAAIATWIVFNGANPLESWSSAHR
ncbi:DoxX family protein [Gordonia shandongensis]|uniref:DoxX family protein n=1 Tax=Gordonia shandongensis TaxID=376351 RepID=UPI00047A4353|nr:DoxX family protein [Gordonia shandongensis]